MTHLRSPEQREGGVRKVTVVDLSTKELLIEVLRELRKIEYHLSIASDTDLTNSNIGD